MLTTKIGARWDGFGGIALLDYLHCNFVDPQTYRRSWKAFDMTKQHANRIAVSTIAADLGGDLVVKIVDFSLGEVSLGGLLPDKPYHIRLEVFDNEVSVWLYNATMQTLPTGDDDENKVSPESPLSQYFHWRHVAPYTCQLGWDVHKLASLAANRIDVFMVVAESFDSPTSRTVNFSQGAVVMEKVRPNTLYVARLDALKDNTKVWYYVGELRTQPIARQIVEGCYTSLPRLTTGLTVTFKHDIRHAALTGRKRRSSGITTAYRRSNWKTGERESTTA
ncbi:unnamed protein product, partial [Hydatigera taeniaeformis]|uniref:Fibronectin type-III domain-containing protein n=1 Tax=Hydatigena taeniaeformis TaxID=6205 RepID=A0A0R3XDE2_HYDTA